MTDTRIKENSKGARRASLVPLLALLSLMPLGMGARGCEEAVVGRECTDADVGVDEDCEPAMCRYDGQRYEAGESFPSTDGCNSCTCQDDGNVACTERACAPSGCEYDGKHFEAGESFPATDGCNSCACQQDGQIACTLRACAPKGCDYGGDLYDVGELLSSDDGCNQCTCQLDGSWDCTGNVCPGDACGGLTGLDCASDEYCNFPLDAQCGAADATGRCMPKPQACILIYAPVCGCDDTTYGNDCQAANAGVSVAHTGECDDATAGQSCGGLTGLPCPDGEYCNYPPGALCGAADATGTCEPRLDVCTAQFEPVCGCDDITYPNACNAAREGVSVLHTGACDDATAGQSCGGLTGLPCPDGEYCNYPLGALCGAADATGTCEPRLDVCTDQFEPVCGCDDMTYPNACNAAREGISVSANGPCP